MAQSGSGMADFRDFADVEEHDIDELEVSLHNLSIEDEDDVGCNPMASTPKKGEKDDASLKHALTPVSKRESEPASKRLNVATDDTDVPKESTEGGSYFKKRRSEYVKILHENYEAKDNSSVQQSVVLATLGLNEFQKVQATNAIKQAFPKTVVKRRGSFGNREIIYEGIGHKSYLRSTHLASSHIDHDEGPEIQNIKELIITTHTKLNSINSKIHDQLSKEDIQRDVIKALLCSQAELQTKVEELHDILTGLFQKEATRLSAQQSHCNALYSEEAKQLNEEVEKFIQYLNIDVESRNDFSAIIPELTNSVEQNCPLLYNILNTILLHKDVRSISKMRVKSAVHAISILVSLRSQKIKNDFKVMFTFLCISFGAGCRFIGMLNHLGLTISWQKAMQLFDDKKKMQKHDLANISPEGIPLMLLIDNINIYRGKRKHQRIVRPKASTMWNFTAQAMLIPELDGIEDLFSDKQFCLTPQGVVTDMKADELFVDSHTEKLEVFEAFVDRYLIGLLDDVLNKVPFTTSHLKAMSEQELKKCLTTEGFKNLPRSEYDINIPSVEDVLNDVTPPVKSNVHILPLSLEDNSTILGTMSILDDLSKTFNLPNEGKTGEYLPYDSTTGAFDLTCARAHFELLLSQRAYETSAKETVAQMRSREKDVDGGLEMVEEVSEDEDDELSKSPYSTESTTLENEKRRFENEDKLFWEDYDYVVQEHLTAVMSNSEEKYMSSLQRAETRQKALSRDHLNRTMLHVAVERNCKTLVQYLVDIGLNVNDREGCGLTALGLAVLQRNTDLVDVLVKCGAKHRGPLFTSIPSPHVMAKTMNLTDILHVFEEDSDLSDEENFLIRRIDSTMGEREDTCMQVADASEEKCDRTQPGFVTPLVGDVGTCKTNNATMSRSASYRWVGICPGDLHNKGYFCEAVFKVHGPSGFHCLLVEVLKRKGLTAAVFKKKKFQEYNLVKVREAIQDCCRAYGLAAALEFVESDLFPSAEDLGNTSSLNGVLLKHFKQWLECSCESDKAFEHRASAFLMYGPLQELYDAATAYGDGVARETVYQVLMPIYAQLGFRNYYTEVFRHVINFLVKWPKATRLLLQKNSCINILGKKGHGIELDAYVEAEVVQPLKNYVSEHTSVSMCERLMANLDMMKSVRRAYMAKDGFDVHPTSKHAVASSLPDQFKGAWFCLKKGFFQRAEREEVECYPLENGCCASGKVSKNLLDVVVKGKEKIRKNFEAKLYECFADLRYKILMS